MVFVDEFQPHEQPEHGAAERLGQARHVVRGPRHERPVGPEAAVGHAPLVPACSVAVRDGEWVFVSGMTGIKPGTQDIIDGGIAVQTRQTMENIRTALASGGATIADVAECTVFLKDTADYAAMNGEYIKFFPVNPPARATLAVTAMPRPAALIEVKCTARRKPK